MVVLTEHTCLDEKQIEDYVLRHLDEREIAVVEERLLVCQRCREIYSHVQTYVSAMHSAMSKARDQQTQLRVRHKTAAC